MNVNLNVLQYLEGFSCHGCPESIVFSLVLFLYKEMTFVVFRYPLFSVSFVTAYVTLRVHKWCLHCHDVSLKSNSDEVESLWRILVVYPEISPNICLFGWFFLCLLVLQILYFATCFV